MKTRLLLLCGLLLVPAVPPSFAQSPEPAVAKPLLNADQLEQLLAPIALYPDALIAVMLPAATAPADLVLAARFLQEHGDTANLDDRTWDESVRSLTHFPSVLKWMDQNLAWTKQLGEAFRDQPAEVMQAIQRLRARARAAGTLGDSAQQQVVVDGDVIAIIPARADAIYIPYYDPTVVYYRPASFYPGGYFTFGGAISVGSWLAFECDWWNRTVWVAPRRPVESGIRDWRRPVFPGRPGYVSDPDRRAWRPAPNSHRPAAPKGNEPPPATGPRPVRPEHPPGERKTVPSLPERPPVRDFGAPARTPITAPGNSAPPPPTTVIAPAARRNPEPGRERARPPEPSTRPAPASAPTPSASPSATMPPGRLPYGNVPTGPVVAPLSSPVVAPLSRPVVAPMPAPAPRVPPPAAAPARAPRDGGEGLDRKKDQPN